MKRGEKLRANASTKHHILPSSRGGTDNSDNIAIVPNKIHNDYHKYFSNRTPDEIICYLVNEFWNGQWWWLEIAKEKYGKEDL